MSSSADILDPLTHARVFSETVVPRSELDEALPHARPKAIILGGQPGAGKGGLTQAAIH
ncbi:MAG: zeta toxin family protein, partial [Rhodanobacter sp.]|nr:zeta toxin family protein [Rhodanobacter sp.]